MFRALSAILAAVSRYLIAVPFFLGAAAWDITARLHTLLWPKQPAVDEPFDFAQELLAVDDDLQAEPLTAWPENELTDFPAGNICSMFALNRLGRWMDGPVDVSPLPVNVQAWLYSLSETQLDHLSEQMRPSAIERHINARDYQDRDPGLPAVVSPETVKRLTRRIAQAPAPQPARSAAMEAPEPAPAYAPAPRF
jgi:hypothetical protein